MYKSKTLGILRKTSGLGVFRAIAHSIVSSVNALLLENGFNLLLENNDFLLME